MKKIIIALLYVFLFSGSWNSFGNSFNTSIQVFTTAQGLPNNAINDVQRDADGFLWIATNNGIARFDGKNFISFSKNTHHNFFQDNVINEIKIVKNSLFLISKKRGIKILNRKTLIITDFIRQSVQSFCSDKQHQLILFSDGSLALYKSQNQVWKKVLTAFDPKEAIFYNNNIFVLTQNKGVLQLGIGSGEKQRTLAAEYVYMYGKLIPSKKYGLVYATGNKVYILQNNQFVFHPLFGNQIGITNYFEDESSQVNYIYRSKTIFEQSTTSFVNQPISSIKNPELRKLFFVNSNCYFVATNQGLVRITKNKKFIFSIDDNSLVEDDMIRIRRKIIPIDAATTYFFGHPQILVSKNGQLKNIVSKNYSMYDGALLGNKIYCTTDSKGTNVFDLVSYKISQLQLTNVPDDTFFYVVEKVNDQEIALGGSNQIVLFNTLTKKTNLISLTGHTVHAITKSGNLVWIGTNKGVLCANYHKGQWVWKSIPKVYAKTIRNITVDTKREKVWLGTEEDGILILDPKTYRYTQKKSSVLKNITSIINDQKGRFVVSTFNGIVVFDLVKNASYELTQKNGLTNSEFNYKSGALLADGTVVFGGLNSYDQIDYEKLLSSIPQKATIQLTGIQKSTTISPQKSTFTNYNNQSTIAFNTGKEELTLFLADLNLYASFNTFFLYQIDQEKKVPATNNTVSVSNLPYGKHDLKLYLYDDYGNLKATKKIVINAIVPFYYRLSFYVFLSGLFLFLATITIYATIKARKTEALVKERIAMDLHDEVGTVLTRMLLIANSKKEIATQQHELKSGIVEALFSIRTSIHALSSSNKTLEDLIDDTKEFLKKEFAHSTIAYQVQHDTEIPILKVKAELFRDCKLILFEAAANVLKYSEASCFTVTFHVENGLEIVLYDDGHLTAIETVFQKGNGIGNIQKRTERNNGNCTFTIHKPHGMNIKLNFKTPFL